MSKTIDELREGFEEMLGLDTGEYVYCADENVYSPHVKYDGFERIEKLHDVCTINGAWWMYQELNK